MDVPSHKGIWASMVGMDEPPVITDASQKIVIADGRNTRVSNTTLEELLNRIQKLEEAVAEMHILGKTGEKNE